jgi:DNA-binding winged helix-turn-helix (wHTH) protein
MVRVMLTPSATTASDSDARRVVPGGTPRLGPGPQGNLAATIEAEQSSQPASSSVGVVSSGPFPLLPAQRLLLQAGNPVRLGARALDMLVALAAKPGALVTKDELIACVWPGTFVEESSLNVHMAALRKALGDGRSGNRYIAKIPGRGCSFVAHQNRHRQLDGFQDGHSC